MLFLAGAVLLNMRLVSARVYQHNNLSIRVLLLSCRERHSAGSIANELADPPGVSPEGPQGCWGLPP